MTEYTYAPIQDQDETKALAKILATCFGGTPDDVEARTPVVGRDNMRLLKDPKGIIGGLWQIPMGQFFSGRSLPMVGIAAVGIQPESRGRGSAHALMSECVRELHQRHVPLSALYPATNELYRRAGYALAGSWCELELDVKRIPHLDRSLEVVPLNQNAHHTEIERVYSAFARGREGYLDRGPYVWERIYHPRNENAEVYGVLLDGQLAATIIFAQEKADSGYNLRVADFAYAHRTAGERLLTFLAQHKSMVDKAWMHGGLNHPVATLLPERVFGLKLRSYWMLRLTHVAGALEGRSYPGHLDLALHMDVADDVVPENNGPITLSVARGEGKVTPGGRGNLTIDVRELASLYAGFLSAKQLVLDGRLQGSPEAVSALETVFSPGAPAMNDMF